MSLTRRRLCDAALLGGRKSLETHALVCKNVVFFNKTVSRGKTGPLGCQLENLCTLDFYPTTLAKNEGFQQIIWTDSSNHEYIEEAGTMNLFFRIGNKLITAPTSDSILDGVTRKSLIQIAKDQGIEVEVRPIKVEELIDARRFFSCSFLSSDIVTDCTIKSNIFK